MYLFQSSDNRVPHSTPWFLVSLAIFFPRSTHLWTKLWFYIVKCITPMFGQNHSIHIQYKQIPPGNPT